MRSAHTSAFAENQRRNLAPGSYLDPAPGPDPDRRSNNGVQRSHRSSVSAVIAAPRHTEVSGVTRHTVASGGFHRMGLNATSRSAAPAEVAGPAAGRVAAPPRKATERLASVVVSGEPVHRLHDIPQVLLDRCKPAFTTSWSNPGPL